MSADQPENTTALSDEAAVCVLCGTPWLNGYVNRCGECGGFCTWGPAKGADPASWTVLADGSWTPKPAPHGPE